MSRHDEALMDKMCNHVTPEGMTRVLKLDAMSVVGFIETFAQDYTIPPRGAFDFIMSLRDTHLWETYMNIDQFLTTEGRRIANRFPTEIFRHMLEVFADDLCE